MYLFNCQFKKIEFKNYFRARNTESTFAGKAANTKLSLSTVRSSTKHSSCKNFFQKSWGGGSRVKENF